MELSDLKVFLAVVQHGGVTRAAQALHRVPSNVSTRIKSLEEDLAVALFLREGKQMQLTPQGKLLLDYATRLLALAEEARGAMHDSNPKGMLQLGAMESTAAMRLPSLLGVLHARYPALSVELRTGPPRPLTAKVLAGELDAALVAEPVSDPRLSSVLAYVEELVLIAPAGHAPIRNAHDLQHTALLAFEPDCPHRGLLMAWCAQDKVAAQRIIELGSYHAMLGCCAAGMGVALIPAAILDTYRERARLSVHKLPRPFQTMRIQLIWRTDAPQPKIKALIGVLAEAGTPRVRKPAGKRAK